MAIGDPGIPNFTRDPTLASQVADQFGGNAARAEQLIIAAQLRQSPELASANLIPEDIDARGQFSDEDVQAAAELEDGQLVPNSATKRGPYLTYLFVAEDGRVGKDALLVKDDGSLEMPDRPETPERAALRAQVKAGRKVDEAQQKAKEIVAKAKEEAQKIIAEAAAKAREEHQKSAEESAKKMEEQDEPQGPPPVDLAASGARQGKPGLEVEPKRRGRRE